MEVQHHLYNSTRDHWQYESPIQWSTCDCSSKVLGIWWDVSADKLVFGLNDIATKVLRVIPENHHSDLWILWPHGIPSSHHCLFQGAVAKNMSTEAIYRMEPSAPSRVSPYLEGTLSQLAKHSTNICPQVLLWQETNTILMCCEGFCDTSNVAHAAVVYLSFDCDDGHISVFVACKTRIALLNLQTIPCCTPCLAS